MIKLRAEWRGVKEGAEFDRLTVLGPQFRLRSYPDLTRWYCVCLCRCGKVIVVVASHLENGNSRSCSCLQRDVASQASWKLVHGECKTNLYHVWAAMKSRCLNKNDQDYKDYGGRGISIYPEWIASFVAFRDWALSHGYRPGLEIDREKNHLGYSP